MADSEALLATLLVVYFPINFGFLYLDWERISTLPFLKKVFWIVLLVSVGIFIAGIGMVVCILQEMRESST
jgi:hypothetical protein